eukprot:GHUV01016030.1.p1 GENE.GHUV01016030.1~~GHUV01016030.1.p1  ORF type:complete len:201 (+),score=67.72 GHUV01016030.1:139-741(+)
MSYQCQLGTAAITHITWQVSANVSSRCPCCVSLLTTATAEGCVTDGARTAVYGPLSTHVQQLLQQGGVRCRIIDSWEEYCAAMVVKLLWSCIFWLLSAGLGGISVGNVVDQHSHAVEALVAELLPIAQGCISSYNSSNSCASSSNAPASAAVQTCGVDSGMQQEATAAGAGLELPRKGYGHAAAARAARTCWTLKLWCRS